VLYQNILSYITGYQAPEYEFFTAIYGIILCVITLLVLIVLIVYPLAFGFYAFLCFTWGMVNMIDGGSTSGLLMYLLGAVFAFRTGFFKKHTQIKIIFIAFFPLAAIISQARFGERLVFLSILNVIALALIFTLVYFLFLPEIQKFTKKAVVAANLAYLSSEQFSEKDIRYLKRIQDGEKYESIAKDEGIGLSTLKNRMKIIYQSLDVYDKTSFMSTYAGYTILLKSMPNIQSDANIHPNKGENA
jgi:hypothetical protein